MAQIMWQDEDQNCFPIISLRTHLVIISIARHYVLTGEFPNTPSVLFFCALYLFKLCYKKYSTFCIKNDYCIGTLLFIRYVYDIMI